MVNNLLKRSIKGELTTDELGKMIILVVGLIVIIYIITVIIKGDISEQGEIVKSTFDVLG
jgi:uncharacterized membrane protein